MEVIKVEDLSNELKESFMLEEQNARTLKPFVMESDNAPVVEIKMVGIIVRFFNHKNPQI